MRTQRKLFSTISITTLALSLLSAGTAFADETPECNAGEEDPTTLECGVDSDASGGPDATAIGTEAVANGPSTTGRHRYRYGGDG